MKLVDIMKLTKKVVPELVAEGKRVGKVPFCEDELCHFQASGLLEDFGIVTRETFQETQLRRANELPENTKEERAIKAATLLTIKY